MPPQRLQRVAERRALIAIVDDQRRPAVADQPRSDEGYRRRSEPARLQRSHTAPVMAGVVPAIHVLFFPEGSVRVDAPGQARGMTTGERAVTRRPDPLPHRARPSALPTPSPCGRIDGSGAHRRTRSQRGSSALPGDPSTRSCQATGTPAPARAACWASRSRGLVSTSSTRAAARNSGRIRAARRGIRHQRAPTRPKLGKDEGGRRAHRLPGFAPPTGRSARRRSG